MDNIRPKYIRTHQSYTKLSKKVQSGIKMIKVDQIGSINGHQSSSYKMESEAMYMGLANILSLNVTT